MKESNHFLEEIISSIRRETENIAQLRMELKDENAKEQPNPRVLGSVLHDFYNCCERIFKRISSEINGSYYEGESWHKELLYRMTIPVKGIRPAVISEDLAAELDDYLSFRHVFRNIYGFELKGDRLVRLKEKFPRVAEEFQKEMRDFVSALGSI